MYGNVLYKRNDTQKSQLFNISTLCIQNYLCKVILRCMNCSVNKQNIYLFYIFVINQWIAMKILSYFKYLKYL